MPSFFYGGIFPGDGRPLPFIILLLPHDRNTYISAALKTLTHPTIYPQICHTAQIPASSHYGGGTFSLPVYQISTSPALDLQVQLLNLLGRTNSCIKHSIYSPYYKLTYSLSLTCRFQILYHNLRFIIAFSAFTMPYFPSVYLRFFAGRPSPPFDLFNTGSCSLIFFFSCSRRVWLVERPSATLYSNVYAISSFSSIKFYFP